MTDTLSPSTSQDSASSRRTVGWLVFFFAASGALLALAEWMATKYSGSAHFAIFWFGYFVAAIPAAIVALRRSTANWLRGAVIAGLGAWGIVPHLLRVGAHPLYFDEMAHFRMLQDLTRIGHPVSSTALLQIGANFPGLELATSALAHLSGMSLWFAAVALAIGAHIALLTGVYFLFRDLTGSARAGAVGAVVYAVNPSWMFFDSQFSYETLAIPLLIWGLVFAMRAIRPTTNDVTPRGRLLNLCLALGFSFALAITHHVTASVSCAILATTAIAIVIQRRAQRTENSAVVATTIAGWAILITGIRFIMVGHPLVVYLGPALHVSEQFKQLLALLGIGSSGPSHSAFGGSTVPVIEIICTFAMLPILLALFVWAVWGLSPKWRNLDGLTYAGIALGATFFVSLALVTSATFAEGVHRSWAFSFLGIAILTAAASRAHELGQINLKMWDQILWPWRGSLHRAMSWVLAVGLSITAVGGVAVGTSVAYRFGGRVVPSTDVSYVGTQSTMVANWFSSHTSSSDAVFGDRYITRLIAVNSRVVIVSSGGSEAGIFLSPTISEAVIDAFLNDHVTYVVYNRRLRAFNKDKPFLWFTQYESSVPEQNRHSIYPNRIECIDWLNAVFATSDYQVLEVNRDLLRQHVDAGSTGLRPGCQVNA